MKLLAVNFHYIRDRVYESGIYPRSLKQLSDQVDRLSKYYTFISQNELSEKIRHRSYDDKNYCLITFDDGLKEQMSAFELLKAKGVPSVYYITTAAIRHKTVVNVHKLHYIMSQLTMDEIKRDIAKVYDISSVIYPDNIDELYRYDTPDVKRVKYLLNFVLDEDTKEKFLRLSFSGLCDEAAYSEELYMNADDIKTLHAHGAVGTHTDRHLPLATLTEEGMRAEIEESMLFLQNVCGIDNVDSVSYPYGGKKAVSQQVADAASDYNFSFGLTMFRGLNTIADMETPLMLKRVDTNDAPGGKTGSAEFEV